MTREERELAIDIFKDNFTVIDTHGHYTEEEECLAIDMAIEALEQERSRLAQITQYRNDCEKLMQENEQLKKALNQEPKTGHWIMDRQRETRQCDKCMTVYRWSFNPHNYCPNCGADMRGEE